MLDVIWIYGVLQYLSSIAILTTTRDQTTHLALVHRSIPYLDHWSKPYYNRRNPTFWLPDLCLKVLTVHSNELHLFWAKAFLLLVLLMPRFDIAVLGTTSNVFCYNAVLGRVFAAELYSHGTTAKPWTHNLPVPSECVTYYATDAGFFTTWQISVYAIS